jgi:hypothetical protein
VCVRALALALSLTLTLTLTLTLRGKYNKVHRLCRSKLPSPIVAMCVHVCARGPKPQTDEKQAREKAYTRVCAGSTGNQALLAQWSRVWGIVTLLVNHEC